MNSVPDSLLIGSSTDPALAQLCDRIIERLQAGDSVDVAALSLEHPEYADQLRRLVPALEVLVDLGASSADHPARADSARTTAEHAPKVLGDYRILREIGRGGMGVVYEAEQRSLNRRVALKVLPMAAALDARRFQRFQLEAQAAACLHHNNIVPVFAVGTEGGVPYYAMQYIEGRSLAQVIGELRRAEGMDPAVPEPGDDPPDDPTTTALARSLIAGGPTLVCATPPEDVTAIDAQPSQPAASEPPASSPRASSGSSTQTRAYARTIAGLGLQVAEALDHAHTRGILHRDIKPGNLILDAENRIWVADFGLAQIQGSPSLTLTGDVLGTLRYMSPEQALGNRVVVDGRTDVYSLGVTIFELLTLRPAVGGKDRAEILARIASDDSPRLRRLNPAVPIDLETIVQKAIANDPTARYATAKDLADDLRSFLDDRPIQARRPSLMDKAAKWARRHTAAMTAVSVVLALAVVGLAASTVMISRERAEAIRQRNFARQAVDEMYTEVAEKWLKNESRSTPLQRRFLEKALALYLDFAAEPRSSDTDRLEATKAAYRVGQIQAQLGRPLDAEKFYNQAIRLASEGGRAEENRLDFLQWESAALDGLGRLRYELLKFDQAEIDFRRALEIKRKISAASPSNSDFADSLATTSTNLGALLSKLRRFEEAEKLLREGLVIREDLSTRFPNNDDYQFNLASSHLHIGNLYLVFARRDDAKREYQKAQAIQADVVARKPDVPSMKDALAGLHRNLASVLNDEGQSAGSEKEARQAITLWKELARSFPDLPEYRNQLALTQRQLASSLGKLGRDEEARQVVDEAIGQLTELHHDFPGVPAYGVTLALTYHDRAYDYLRRGKIADAEADFRRCIDLRSDLAEADPTEPERRVLMVNSLHQLGGLLRSHGRSAEADAIQRRAMSINESLVRDFPDRPYYRGQLGASLHNVAMILRENGELNEARAMLERAIELQRTALASLPHDQNLQQFLRNHLATHMDILARQGDHAGAIRQAHVLADQFLQLWEVAHDAAWTLMDTSAYVEQDTKLDPSGREAITAQYQAAIRTLLDQAIQRGQGDASAGNGIAWLLITCEPRFRDPVRAVELARDAVERQPTNGGYWDTLGVAHYLSGDWDNAIKALEQSIRHRAEPDGPDFVLAMALWKAGRQNEARAVQERSSKWLTQHPAVSDDINNRFRKEAEDLLGTTPQPTEKKESVPRCGADSQ